MIDFKETNEIVQENHGTLYLTISVFLVILCFFIMINAISSSNTDKTQNITKSLKHEFLDKKMKERLKILPQQPGYNKIDQSKVKDFKDIMNDFLALQKANADASFKESATSYLIDIRSISFFAPNSTEVRAPAENFILALNKYIFLNKKMPEATAKLVFFYDAKNIASITEAKEKIKNLAAILEDETQQNMSFSYVPLGKYSDRNNLNQINILFSKNEF